MKCPQCGFLCSDLRDVCGKCFVDLRPRKRELGIKIIRPDARYEDLVEKVAQKVQAQAERKSQGGLLGSFMSMIGGSPSTEPVTKWVPIERKEEVVEEAEPLPVSLPEPRPEPAITTPRPKQIGRSVKFKRSSTAVDAPPIAAAAPEVAATLSPSPLDAFSTEELWGETYNAITFNGGAAEFEFQTSQLRTYAPEKEEIEILWALSDEAIQDPDSQRRYRDISKSEVRRVEAEAAKQALEKVEKSLVSQVFSLKRGGPKLTKKDDAIAVAAGVRLATHKVDPATRSERISAGMVDLGYLILVAALLTFCSAWFISPEIRGTLIRPRSLNAPDAAALGCVFMIFLLSLGVLYPLLSGVRTAGQKLFGLEVIEATGRDASPQELFLRSAMLPVSTLCSFIVPALWHEVGFHNRYSNTVTTRLSAED